MARTKQTARRSGASSPIFRPMVEWDPRGESPLPTVPTTTASAAWRERFWERRMLQRSGPPFATHYGLPDEAPFKERIRAWLHARKAWLALQRRVRFYE